MGVYDIFCLVCGGPPSTPTLDTCPELIRALGNAYSQEVAWLEQYVGVPADGALVENLSYNNGGAYELPEGGSKLFHAYHPNYAAGEVFEDDLHGLTCHMACYHLLHEKLNYKLQFEDVWPILESNPQPSECLQNDYGGITKYHDQDFDWKSMQEDGTGWMVLNPCRNENNADRILQVWTPLVQSFHHAHRERRKREVRPMLTALYCCFSKARESVDLPASEMSVDQLLVWERMAAIPVSLVHVIAIKAELAWE